ncbi:glycosyltransferase family 2 protein [Anthocerotibacter panamensis]|uniref:glycosyltransferase family 2 protein n=1 Tax=Anthocerotibacter panamensis TaxID=2857077 RepID=UPI001C407A93|nr:glycosyltransferase family 2 protein [Anthocerotibacter panamensis]
MDNSLKLSIITVTFNSVKTLENTIQSVIAQGYPNTEYIIIDGGSTDGTLEIIEQYKNYLTCWLSEPDEGIYDAMNKGIKISSGEVIGIINSDDYYTEGAFQKLVSVFQNMPETDVLYANILYEIPNSTAFIAKSRYPLKRSDFYCMPILHPTVFVRSSCYKKYGKFNIKYKLSADHELMLRLLEGSANFYYLNETLAYMRAGGVSYNNLLKGLSEIKEILTQRETTAYTYLRFTLLYFKCFIYSYYRNLNQNKLGF